MSKVGLIYQKLARSNTKRWNQPYAVEKFKYYTITVMARCKQHT